MHKEGIGRLCNIKCQFIHTQKRVFSFPRQPNTQISFLTQKVHPRQADIWQSLWIRCQSTCAAFPTGPTTLPQLWKWGSLGFEKRGTKRRTAWLIDQMETTPPNETLGKGCQESFTYGATWFNTNLMVLINVWAMCSVQLLHGSYQEPPGRRKGLSLYYLLVISNIRLTNELLLKVSKTYIALWEDSCLKEIIYKVS